MRKKMWKHLAQQIARAALKAAKHLPQEEQARRIKAFCRAVKRGRV